MKKYLLIPALLLFVQAAYSQAWIQRTNFGGTGRHRASGFSIGNRGYIGIGHVNGNNINISYKDFWEYDPSTDSWSQKADYPIPNYGAIAFATSTRGYIGGGAALGPEFYEYNPQTNTWTAIANCPVSPGDQGCFSVNDKGYVVFGAALYEYNPQTNAWTTKTSAPITFNNWCVGFSSGSSGFIKSGSNLYEYKPLYDQWVIRAGFPGLNSNGAAAFVRSGKAYVISGYSGALANVVPEVWEYSIGSDDWTRINDFPGSSRRFTVAFTINNRGYFGTGTNGINFNDFWEMNDAVSVNEIASESINVKSYPNPATEYVQFSIINSNQVSFDQNEIRLYAMNGELVAAESFSGSEFRMERNGKSAGMYFYEIYAEGKKLNTGKIIFQ